MPNSNVSDGMPLDWQDRIVHAYAVFGVDPLGHADEFGFPRLSVSFLREKAEQQLRDALGRFREMRGRIDGDRAPVRGLRRSGAGPSEVALLRRQPNQETEVVGGFGRSAENPTIADGMVLERRLGPIQHLRGKKAARMLEAAGIPKRIIPYYSKRGTTITRDGVNFTWVPSISESKMLEEEADIKHQIEYTAEIIENIRSIQFKTDEERAQLSAAEEVMKKLSIDLDNLENAIMFFESKKSDPKTIAVAEKALDHLEQASDAVPDWRRLGGADGRRRRPFMALIDKNMMVDNNALGEAVPSSYYMIIAKDQLDAEFVQDKKDKWILDTGTDSQLEYTVFHEMGHLIDPYDRSDTMSSMHPSNATIYDAAKSLDMSNYGSSNPREGFAEAAGDFLRNHYQANPLSILYANYFGLTGANQPIEPYLASEIQFAYNDYIKAMRSGDAALMRKAKDHLFDRIEVLSQRLNMDFLKKEHKKAQRIAKIKALREW